MIQGHLKDLPPKPPSEVRIFVSSTFSGESEFYEQVRSKCQVKHISPRSLHQYSGMFECFNITYESDTDVIRKQPYERRDKSSSALENMVQWMK